MNDPRGTRMPENLTPLEMALNCVAVVAAAARFQAEGDTDPEKRLLAHVHHVGERADQDSKIAARMALVSIAQDIHALASTEPEDDELVNGDQVDGYVKAMALARDLASATYEGLAQFDEFRSRARAVEAIFDGFPADEGIAP